MDNTLPSAEKQVVPGQPKKTGNPIMYFIIVLLVAILCAIIGAGGVLLINISSNDNSDESEHFDEPEFNTTIKHEIPNNDIEDKDIEPKSVQYKGNYFSAELPAGWDITEYVNGNGSDMLVSGVTYVGLTGLSVSAPGNNIVFEMKGVYGIGGVSACNEYFKFPDDNNSYYTQIKNQSVALGVTPVVINIASGNYTDFDYLGKDFRRSGTDLYWDTQGGNATFEAGCGIDTNILSFTGLSFTGDGFPVDSYQVSVVGSPTNAELTTMDNILDSMTL